MTRLILKSVSFGLLCSFSSFLLLIVGYMVVVWSFDIDSAWLSVSRFCAVISFIGCSMVYFTEQNDKRGREDVEKRLKISAEKLWLNIFK